MRPVTLNLASRPFRNNMVVGSVLGIAGAALVFASAYNLYIFLGYGSSYAQLKREQADDRAKIVSLQVEERRLVEEVRKRNFKRVFEQGKIASELIVRGAFSWTQLFNTLEEVVPPDVVMIAIRPNITTEGIVMRIEGVAKNHGALLTFETRLQESPAFAKVFPSNERRLNPSLPDITFLLTCDYSPHRQAAPDLVAAAGSKEDSAPQAGVGAESAAASAASAVKTPPAPRSAQEGKTETHPTDAVVGRDGSPRLRRAAGGPIVAPGSLYAPEALPAAKPAKKPAASRAGAARGSPPASTEPKPAPAAGAVAPKSETAPTKTAAADPAPSPDRPVTTPSGPRGYDPNLPHTMPPKLQAQVVAQSRVEKKPAPAVRLDVPLTFVSRPVEEVYQRLAEAHGVRFDLDDSVDRSAPVTLNLRGRKLEDALLIVSGTARHKVKRVAEGVYKVSADQGGRAIEEPKVNEEPIRQEQP